MVAKISLLVLLLQASFPAVIEGEPVAYEAWDNMDTESREYQRYKQCGDGQGDVLMQWSDDRVRNRIVEELGQPAKDVSILVPGVKNQHVAEQMWYSGYRNLTVIDENEKSIRKLLRRNEYKSGLNYLRTAYDDMAIEDQAFDFIFDKEVFDEIMTENNFLRVSSGYLKECYRILKPAGKVLYYSHAHPIIRNNYVNLRHLKFKVSHHRIGLNYLYILEKPGESGEDSTSEVDRDTLARSIYNTEHVNRGRERTSEDVLLEGMGDQWGHLSAGMESYLQELEDYLTDVEVLDKDLDKIFDRQKERERRRQKRGTSK